MSKKSRQALAAKVKAKVNKVGQAIKKAAVKVIHVAEDIPFAPLLPFKPIMVRALDEKKVEHTDKLHDIALKFLKHVVQTHHFEEYASYFEEGNGSLHLEGYDADGVVGIATDIVKAVIDYIRQLRAKKQAGEQMTEEEAKVLAQAETIATPLVKAADKEPDGDDIASQAKAFLFSWKGAVALAVLGLLIYLAVKK